MIGRIVRSVDFERVMAKPICAKTSHFALHHLLGQPSLPAKPKAVRARQHAHAAVANHMSESELLTGPSVDQLVFVDDLNVSSLPVASNRQLLWFGMVVPKRYAKRSVTRTLLKRQIRAAFHQQHLQTDALSPGLWVLRLRAAFELKRFKSAASDELQVTVREELSSLLAQAVCSKAPSLRSSLKKS